MGVMIFTNEWDDGLLEIQINSIHYKNLNLKYCAFGSLPPARGAHIPYSQRNMLNEKMYSRNSI